MMMAFVAWSRCGGVGRHLITMSNSVKYIRVPTLLRPYSIPAVSARRDDHLSSVAMSNYDSGCGEVELEAGKNFRPINNEDIANVKGLLTARKAWYSLDVSFYNSPSIFGIDMEAVFRRSWLFAGFSFEIPNTGDFMTFNQHNDSVIIVRDKCGTIRAHHNTCRHRGSRVCSRGNGNLKSFVCPYHRWTYRLDGTLLAARHMPDDFNKAEHGLHPCRIEEVGGLIFIALSEHAPDFTEARNKVEPQVVPHDFANAKVAHRIDYEINANWKVVMENNRECLHCVGGHPEYIKANYDSYLGFYEMKDGRMARGARPDHPMFSEIEEHRTKKTNEWLSKFGIECSVDSSFGDADGWLRASRMPNRVGWLTESMDGQPVSNLMGALTDYDMGSMRIHGLPAYWMHASSDHAVSTRLIPISPTKTRAQTQWIVNKSAVEGKDYTLDKLIPFWARTSEQDWYLCELNMAGMLSSKYKPSPFSTSKESGLERFIVWYLRRLEAAVDEGDLMKGS